MIRLAYRAAVVHGKLRQRPHGGFQRDFLHRSAALLIRQSFSDYGYQDWDQENWYPAMYDDDHDMYKDADYDIDHQIERLKDKTVAELKELLRERGLKVSGKKADLLNRLQLSYTSSESDVLDDSDVEDESSDDDDDDDDEEAVEEEVEVDNEFCFDTSDNYKLIPRSKLEEQGRLSDAMAVPPDEEARTTVHEAESLLQLLPPDFMHELSEELLPDLMEVVLDVGKRPFAWVNGDRHFLSRDVVTQEQLQAIVEPLHFGPDNRAGINGSLHRISAIRNREEQCVGLTLRVGRYVPGNSLMIADILAGMPNASILIVGEPGSGKTSIIRDAARFLAERHSLLIVDTSCEIGGSGDVPHECIGLSRRMQVKSVNTQAAVMVECVQNHTPEIMVIDEIGREAEVKAALTCKERGVRIVASAHGNMPGLVRNAALCDLVGGVEVVTVGDRAAERDRKRGGGNSIPSKLKAQRRGPPIFDVIIELKRGQLHEWQVVLHSASAVDSILTDGQYKSQVRTREGSGATSIRVRHVTRDASHLDKIIEEAFHNESMLNPIPMNKQEYNSARYEPEDDPYVPQNAPAHLDPFSKKCRTCPSCKKVLKARKGFLSHVFNKGICRRQFPSDLLEFLCDEARKTGVGVPYMLV